MQIITKEICWRCGTEILTLLIRLRADASVCTFTGKSLYCHHSVMPIDEKTYRRNSRSTQTESVPVITQSQSKAKARSLFGSVIDFVTTATTSASLEFDRLCESFGIANKDSESEYEYVTDSEEDEIEEYEYPTYDDSEVEKLEVSSIALTIPTQTPSRLEQPRSAWKSNVIKEENVTYNNHRPVVNQNTLVTNAQQPIRRWSPPRRNFLVTKQESSSDEEWKPPGMFQTRVIMHVF
jgi:hypothetical protein